jgi:hypothetical protein
LKAYNEEANEEISMIKGFIDKERFLLESFI